jgi:DNA-binding NarL/FixJ family response regulator
MGQGLHTVLELEPGFPVVAEASDGEETVRAYADLQGQGPDIVLIDIQMLRQNGVQATAAILTAYPGARIIILTKFDYEDHVFEAIRAGAMGYLPNGVPAIELAETIRKARAGVQMEGEHCRIRKRSVPLFVKIVPGFDLSRHKAIDVLYVKRDYSMIY